MPESPIPTENLIEPPGSIIIDVARIPDIRRDEILESMTAPLTEFFARPDTQAKFEAWLKARKEKATAAAAT